MADPQALAVQEKKELVSKEEKTVPARYYVQITDIYETDDALTVVMEIPGVEKKDVEVNVENDVLRVEGRVDFTKYEGLEPLYTECYPHRLADGIAYRRLTMWAMFLLGPAILGWPFKSKRRLEAENATLRHQLNVLRRKVRGRVRLTNCDRWFFVHLYRWFPSALQVVTIVRPETVVALASGRLSPLLAL